MLKQQQQDHICHVFYISALQISNKIKSLNTDSAICQGLQLLMKFVGNTNKNSTPKTYNSTINGHTAIKQCFDLLIFTCII